MKSLDDVKKSLYLAGEFLRKQEIQSIAVIVPGGLIEYRNFGTYQEEVTSAGLMGDPENVPPASWKALYEEIDRRIDEKHSNEQ